MADKDKNEKDGEKAAPPAPAGPRFRIRTPAAGFTRVHTCGLRFIDGIAYTDDADVAAHCRDNCGYEVADQKTGKVANPVSWDAPPPGVTVAQANAARQKALEARAATEAAGAAARAGAVVAAAK